MTDQPSAYNPLDKVHLAESIAGAITARPVHPLPPESPFIGAGIYAIYYEGPFSLYAPISSKKCETPIYVGSALPEGGRTGGVGFEAAPATKKLHARLRQHARSIEEARNLEIGDFRCRLLIVDDVWIPLGENYLISLYRPLWNSKVLSGFGIHAPGMKGRGKQMRSFWDELHPGRGHTKGRPPAQLSRDKICDAVKQELKGRSRHQS